jgi:tripartite-type tricarboxylate transporter receptor subunit TctC
MRISRRRFLDLAAATVALPAASRMARGGAYPTQPIRLVIPFAPGGANDAVGRPWAEKVKPLLGTVVIENIGGAGGALGAGAVARARPDGYTILQGNIGNQVIIPLASTRRSPSLRSTSSGKASLMDWRPRASGPTALRSSSGSASCPI